MKRILSGETLIQARSAAVHHLRQEADAIFQEFESRSRPYQDVEQAEADLQAARLHEIETRYSLIFHKIKLLYLTRQLAPQADMPQLKP